MISVVSPTDTEKGKVHNVRRREKLVSRQSKTEVHYEQHHHVARHWSDCVLCLRRHLGAQPLVGRPPRLRGVKEAKPESWRGVSDTPRQLFTDLQSVNMGLLQCRRLDGGGWLKKKGDDCGSTIQNQGVDPSLRPGAVLRAFAFSTFDFCCISNRHGKGESA